MALQRVCLPAFFLSVLFLPVVSQAVDRQWIDTSLGLNNWNEATNWNPSDDYVKAGDNAIFDQNAPYLVIVQAPSAASNITFLDGNVTIGGGTLNAGGMTTINDPLATGLLNGAQVTFSGTAWDNAGDSIVGDTGYGSLKIDSAGDFEADQIFVGNQEGGVGEITLTGDGTTLTASLNSNTGVHVIGRGGGTGTINVLAGADLLTTSTAGNDIWVGGHVDDDTLLPTVPSTGTLNVDGVGSFVETEDLNVGIFGGTGYLNITSGAQVILHDGGTNGSPDAQFGANTRSDGQKSTGIGVVDGDGSLLQSRTLFVGGSGTGQLEVRAGGVVRTQTQGTASGDALIGFNAGSDGKVAVYGTQTDGTTPSLLDVDESLFVGDNGLGVLNIGRDENDTEIGSGALQVDLSLVIGNAAGTNLENKVVVSGADTSANIGSTLIAGNNGKGTFEARGGATITIGSDLDVGLLGDSNGTALLDGAGTTLSATRAFVGNGSGNGSTGTMTVSGGAQATFTAAVGGGTNAVGLGDDGDGVGTLTVTGAGSLVQTTNANGGWFIGGSDNENGGTGTANILAGGHGISASNVIIGYNSGANGTLNVDGPDSLFEGNGGRIRVGDSGVGVMNVTGGGKVTANLIVVADTNTGANGSHVIIDGSGSRVEVNGPVVAGDGGLGYITVLNGGVLQTNIGVTNFGANVATIGGIASTDGSFITVAGPGSRWEQNGYIRVGNAGGSPGTPAVDLNVQNGGYVETSYLSMSRLDGSASSVVVTGAGSLLRSIDARPGGGTSPGFGDVRMVPSGSNGQAEIIVSAGGKIEVDTNIEIGSGDSTGSATVNVTGANSRIDAGELVYVSRGATPGTLNVADGGQLANGGHAFLGFTSGLGTANIGHEAGMDVGDARARWSIGDNATGADLFLGGTASANGLVSTSNAVRGILNVNPTGTVSVGGLVKVWDRGAVNLNGGTLELKDLDLTPTSGTIPNDPTFNFNSGTLRFTDAAGATLDAARLQGILGSNPSLVAGQQLVVDHAATLTTTLRLNGGSFSVGTATPADLAKLDWDAGTLNITGQNLPVGNGGLLGPSVILNQNQTLGVPNNQVTVNAGADLNVIRGALNAAAAANNGLVVISNTTDVDFDADNNGTGLTNNGDLVVIDSTIAGDVANNGTLEIVGDVMFTDNVTLGAASALGIDLAGTQVGEFDSLTSAEFLTLDGALDVSLQGGYTPQLGDSFGILRGLSGFSGSFDTLNLPTLDPGLTWQLNPGAITVFLNVVSSDITGDFDNDGDVDGRDFLLWQRGGSPNPLSPADLAVWQANYGNTVSTATAAAVPEPQTLGLLIMTLTYLLSSRRGKQ